MILIIFCIKFRALENDINHLVNAYNTGIYIAKKFNWDIINCFDDNGNLKNVQEIQNEIQDKIKDLI